MPIYILQALNTRTGLNQLTMSSVPYFLPHRLTREFASAKTNAIEKYGEDLEKMKMNGPGKQKLGRGRNSGAAKHTWLYSDLLCAFKGKHSSALGF